jgi:hypothetical protein
MIENNNEIIKNREEDKYVNEVEENNNLLSEKENNKGTINSKNNIDNNQEEIKESLLKNNPDNNNIDKIINEESIKKSKETSNETVITDYLITIQYTKYFKIPYFIFSKIIHFYFPCTKFQSGQINLSQIQTPPFAIVTEGCK